MERPKDKEAQQVQERTKRYLTLSLATGQKGKSSGARARRAVSARGHYGGSPHTTFWSEGRSPESSPSRSWRPCGRAGLTAVRGQKLRAGAQPGRLRPRVPREAGRGGGARRKHKLRRAAGPARNGHSRAEKPPAGPLPNSPGTSSRGSTGGSTGGGRRPAPPAHHHRRHHLTTLYREKAPTAK